MLASSLRMDAKPSLLSTLRMIEPLHCVECLITWSAYSLSTFIILLPCMLTLSSLSCSVFKPVCC